MDAELLVASPCWSTGLLSTSAPAPAALIEFLEELRQAGAGGKWGRDVGKLHAREARDEHDFCAVKVGQLVLDDGVLFHSKRFGIGNIDTVARRPGKSAGEVIDEHLAVSLVRFRYGQEQPWHAPHDLFLRSLGLDIRDLGSLDVGPALGGLHDEKPGRLYAGVVAVAQNPFATPRDLGLESLELGHGAVGRRRLVSFEMDRDFLAREVFLEVAGASSFTGTSTSRISTEDSTGATLSIQ